MVIVQDACYRSGLCYTLGLGYSSGHENCYCLGQNGYLFEHMAILLDNLFIVEELVIVTDNIKIYHVTWWQANTSGLDLKLPQLTVASCQLHNHVMIIDYMKKLMKDE